MSVSSAATHLAGTLSRLKAGFRSLQTQLEMLDSSSSTTAHLLQNFSLLILSICMLPIDTLVLLSALSLRFVFGSSCFTRRERNRQAPGFRPQTILVTGLGMTKGLVLARSFYIAGHDVIGADFESNGGLVCGRVSKSLRRFFPLPEPDAARGSKAYVEELIDIIQKERVSLFVSCSGVVSAVDDGFAKEEIGRRTACCSIQFDASTTRLLHEKDTFINYVSDLGLTVPTTHTIRNINEATKILSNTVAGMKYILKATGVDDASRGDLTLLPLATEAKTKAHLSSLDITPEKPWILQQFIVGKEYCTHSLIVRGQVKAFAACPSSELLMHYEMVPASSVLSDAMLHFTQVLASDRGDGFTGHLSFDFLVEERKGEDLILYPIECNPRCHTAVILFSGDAEILSSAYTSALDTQLVDDEGMRHLVTPTVLKKYHWIGHDVVVNLLLPLLSLLTSRAPMIDVLNKLGNFVRIHATYKDGTFLFWDPLPWWWLYHAYWPVRFIACIWRRQKWSRLNVSTTKMFQC